MIYKIKDIANKFRIALGDSTMDVPDDFIINGINWAFNDLPLVPKLEKLFSKHYTPTLDAKEHYKWNLNEDFRRLLDIPMLEFYTSTGGDPCKLYICERNVVDFYKKNGIINLKRPGKPCEYTIETDKKHFILTLKIKTAAKNIVLPQLF